MKDRLLRVPVIGTALRMQERYTEDSADSFAASIAFFGFLSLVPLIMLGLSVLGFVLRGDASMQGQVVDAVQGAVPGLGQALGEGGVQGLVDQAQSNAGSLLSFGSVALLVTGLKVIAGAQRALAVVFRMELPTGVAARLQQLLALGVLGLLALLGSAAGGSIGVDLGSGAQGVAVSLGLTLLTFVLDLALFLVAYRMLSPDPGEPRWRALLPGSVLAAVAWVALKAGGATLLAGNSSESRYGALAGAVGILLLLYLAGRIFMYGAELSALLSGMHAQDEEAAHAGLVEPPPREDVAAPPAELAKLAGAAAVLAVATKLFGSD